MREPKILRRLKTADGIVGPIEEIPEVRWKEERAVKTKVSMFYSGELHDAPPFTSRTYRVVKEVPCLLIEMEEQ